MTLLQASPEHIDAISAQARQVDIGRLLLAFVAAVLIGAGRTVGAVVNGFVWAFLAVREGYRDARSPKRDGGTG